MAKDDKRKPSPSSRRTSARGRQPPSWRARVVTTWQLLLDNNAIWVVLLIVVGGWCLAPSNLFTPQLRAGEIATRDVLAPSERLVLDEATTEEHRQRAREMVRPIYDHDSGAAADLDAQLATLFAEGRDFLSYTSEGEDLPEGFEENLLVAVETASALKIAPEQLHVLWARGFGTDLEDRMRSLVRGIMRSGVVDNKALLLENRLEGVTRRDLRTGNEELALDLYDYRGYPEEVRQHLESELAVWRGFTKVERRELQSLLLTNISPNLYLNRAETARRREAAADREEQVFRQIRKGQVIVRKGDEIDDAAVRIWDEMRGRVWSRSQLLPLLGSFLLLILVSLVLWLALHKEQRARGQVRPKLGGLLLLFMLALLAVQFGQFLSLELSEAEASPVESARTYAYAIPFAALALVTSLLYGRATALVMAVLFSVVVGRLFVEDAVWAMVYCLAGSMAAIYSLDKLKERSAVTRAGVVVALANMVTSLMLTAFGAESGLSATRLGFDLLCAFAGGLLVAATTSFLLPVLEPLLSVTTDIKLLELSDTNLPLLRRLAFEAPGTFQHSLMVANLAKEGCEAIGANPVLAYTGGLYHDIGKMLRPDYFVENQRGGPNRHDKLSPSMSSLIVISHVKDGHQMAQEHRLPQPIKDAILQHHGTRILTFFYKRAEELAARGGEAVSASDYRYPGPKPQSKVMGVLMYADAVEAASRTLVSPNRSQLRSLLRKILDSCVQDGQLDETDLTLSDLSRVSEAFLRVLETTYHKRVDYPGFDFKGQRAAKHLRVVDGARR